MSLIGFDEMIRQKQASHHIRLLRETDADLAQALEQNLFVTKIRLTLGGAQQADWNSLLRVIATRSNLEEVAVWRTNALLVRSILRAIQQNSSITKFCLSECDMDPAERQQGTRDLSAALQRNANIESLELGTLGDIYAIAILEGLRSNTSVKTLVFSGVPFSDAAAHALQHVLESTTSIQRFELQNEATFSEILFRPLAQGIINSECVSELKLSWCRFENQSITDLRSILQNRLNLTSLCLHHCSLGRGQVHGDIITLLLRPDSLLQCFEFQSCRRAFETVESVFPGMQFRNLLQAIQKSKLERFQIGSIQTQQQLQTLTQNIPSMHIRELHVVVGAQWGSRFYFTAKQQLWLAIQKNVSLHTVKGEMGQNHEFYDLFESAEDRQRLAFYANRNESLDHWFDHPETVEQKVWPDVLSLAAAGPNALFRGLRSVLGRDYVSLPGGKVSKRPQHDCTP